MEIRWRQSLARIQNVLIRLALRLMPGLLAATYAKYDVKIYTTTDSVNAVKTASGTISLSPKGNQAIRLPVSLGKGSYVVKATVGKTDAGEWQFNEWNTGNNALSLKLTV